VIDKVAPAPTDHTAMNLPLYKAALIGLFQVLSIIPGVSRSGSTIVGSMLLRINKRAAAEFSFFLAIPIMVVAFVLDFWESRDFLTGDRHHRDRLCGLVRLRPDLVIRLTLELFAQKRVLCAVRVGVRILVGGAGSAAIYAGAIHG